MKKIISIFVICILMDAAYADHTPNYSTPYAKAKSLMKNHQYDQAIQIMERLKRNKHGIHLLLSLGDAYALKEKPEPALHNYSIVYHQAIKQHNTIFQRIALFKMARMQFWLGNHQATIATYQQLLAMNLSAHDRTLAQAGLRAAQNDQQHQTHEQQRQLYENTLQQAREANYTNDAKRAYSLIKHHLHQKEDARLYLIAADSKALNDKPEKALVFYKQALQQSQDQEQTTRALFGIAKMQFWLGHYVAAEKTYRRLLALPLNPTDHELALAGLVKSLAYYNRPRAAYRAIPPRITATTPDLVVAAAQASSWANWAHISQSILTRDQPITNGLNPASSLSKDLQDLQWQNKLATNPNVLTPSVFSSHDSEHFDKTRSILGYSRYWNQIAQTTVGLDYIVYTQNNPNRLNAQGIYIGQTLRPTLDLIVQGQIEPIEYKNLTPVVRNNWSPFLWNVNATYTPNDYLSMRALALTEVVETFPAFNNHITDNQYAGALTINPLPYVQLNGSYAQLNFSDTNIRHSGSLSATVAVFPNYGLSASGILRGLSNAFSSPNYFSPHEYWADAFSLKLSRKLGTTWHYYLDGGLGRQYITALPDAPTAASPTYQWGLGITGPINPWLILNAYYADVQQASAYLDSPGYHYQYGGISLNILL